MNSKEQLYNNKNYQDQNNQKMKKLYENIYKNYSIKKLNKLYNMD